MGPMAHLPDKQRLLAEVAPYRAKWSPRPADVTPEPAGPGEESVWDYPRPPELRPARGRARVIFAGETVADSENALRVVETAGAPVYYFPPADVMTDALKRADGVSICEWKGAAIYYDLIVGGERSEQAAFSYPDPLDDLGVGFLRIAGWFGFYPGRVDACYVGEEKVTPQPGSLYAGWVTSDIKGPIKGAPGTGHW
ncbi:MAG: DUF427 domain-containing protein [Pseudomonadota bacterium]